MTTTGIHPWKAYFWKIRAGTKICDFLLLFQTDLKNCSQEINDKKDIQFHGGVINNRLFNLIHFSSREEVFVVLV